MIIRFFIDDVCMNCFHAGLIYNKVKKKYEKRTNVSVLLFKKPEDINSFKLYGVKRIPTVIVDKGKCKKVVRYEGISSIFDAQEDL